MHCLSVAVSILVFSSSCLAGPAVVPVNSARGPVLVPVEQLSFRPYEFGYQLGDGLGMTQHRREVADGSGAVRGSYGYLDPLGINRIVEYQADNNGYRAVVNSNEPGLAGQNAADAVYVVRPPPPAAVAQGLRFVLPQLTI